MNDFEREALAVGIRELFRRPFFSISDFGALACLSGVVVEVDLMKTLSPLHSVAWGAMRAEFRAEVARRVLATLYPDSDAPEVRVTDAGIELVEIKAVPDPKTPWVRRLLGGPS